MKMTQMKMETWMDLLSQIKVRVMSLIVKTMENLPFLSKSEPQSRSAPLPPPDASEPENRGAAWEQFEVEREPRPRFPLEFAPPLEKKDPFAALKENHVALILLGIVIGVIIMNMRPIIVNSGGALAKH